MQRSAYSKKQQQGLIVLIQRIAELERQVQETKAGNAQLEAENAALRQRA